MTDSPSLRKGKSKGEEGQFPNMSDLYPSLDQDSILPSTPLKQTALPTDVHPLTGTKLHSAASPARKIAGNDEATVEAALHAFLYAITWRFVTSKSTAGPMAEWSTKHLYLKCGRWVAITDGLLKAASGKLKAIVEVKPIPREDSIGLIRAQESGQMVA
ncbi:hypothetical protein MMC10_009183 [Thelotrema lepadinum]|nr:hypothetical protein [Thelotrema lepadinum]